MALLLLPTGLSDSSAVTPHAAATLARAAAGAHARCGVLSLTDVTIEADIPGARAPRLGSAVAAALLHTALRAASAVANVVRLAARAAAPAAAPLAARAVHAATRVAAAFHQAPPCPPLPRRLPRWPLAH
jgi:hypothetical protein